MLRKTLLALGLLCLLIAAVLFVRGQPVVAAVWLLLNGLALTLGVVFERWRYKPQLQQRPDANWQASGERFVDPGSGKLVEVYCHRSSGERVYVEIGGQPPA